MGDSGKKAKVSLIIRFKNLLRMSWIFRSNKLAEFIKLGSFEYHSYNKFLIQLRELRFR